MLKANELAFQKMIETDPVLVDIVLLKDAVKIEKTTFLHAGPPISFEKMCTPMKGAVICGLLNERLADSPQEAEKMALSGKITFKPCHEYGLVGPMTGITTYSMPVWVVEDRKTKKRSFANLSEGSGVGLRFGEYTKETLDRLDWMKDTAMPVFKEVIKQLGGIDLAPIMAQGLSMGDELHMRNHATTAQIVKLISYKIAEISPEHGSAVIKYMSVGNDQFFLNLAMAANKLAADAADNIKGSSMVVAIARNGVEIGIRISGLPGKWFTAPSPMVKGLYFPGYSEKDANPDIGDSAIMETGGFGGCAMITAPAIIKFVGAKNVKVAENLTESMYEISLGEHPIYQIPILNFRGIPVGIDIMKVVETGITPVLNTAIASNQSGVGMVGAGMSTLPISIFEDALVALSESL